MTRRDHGARTCCKPTWTSSLAKSAHSPSLFPLHPLLSIPPRPCAACMPVIVEILLSWQLHLTRSLEKRGLCKA